MKLHKGKKSPWDFSGGAVVKNPLANTGDTGSTPDFVIFQV